MTVSTKKIIRLIRYLIFTVAIVFLAMKFWHCRESIGDLRITSRMVGTFIVSSIGYVFNASFVVLAWHSLLKFFGEKNLRFKDSYVVYARSQIARYIPGNVLHIPARHLAGRDLGYGHGPLVGAALYEILGTICASGLILIVGYLLFNVTLQQVSLWQIFFIVVLICLFPMVFNKIFPYIPFLKNTEIPKRDTDQIIKGLIPILGYYCVFFIVLGTIFLFVVDSFSVLNSVSRIGKILTIFVMSVIVGYITPGAPGGLGIREAVLVYMLGGIIGQNESLWVAIWFRAITVLGDLLLFLIPFILVSGAKVKES